MYGNNRWGAEVRRQFMQGGIPITLGVMIANVVTFFLIAGLPRFGLGNYFNFSTPNWPHFFWTPLTWPLSGANQGPLGLLFAAGWFYTFAGSLERAWGSRDFALFLLGVAVVMALSIWAASFVLGAGLLMGLWVISGPVSVAWAAINRREVISFFFLPLPAPALGLLGLAMVWYYGGAMYGNPLIGLVALSGCAAAYWFAMGGRRTLLGFLKPNPAQYGGFRPNSSDKRGQGARTQPFSLSRYLRDRRDRRRLENILRRSGFDGKDDDLR